MMVNPPKTKTPVPTCGKTNHPAERCWNGAGARLKPKHLKLDDSTVGEPTSSQTDTTDKPTTSSLKTPEKPKSSLFQVNSIVYVRQYILSDPSKVLYNKNYLTQKTSPSADWQQQMKSTPTHMYYLDHRFDRLQEKNFAHSFPSPNGQILPLFA